METCCDKVTDDSVRWNPLNGVVQCHACGTVWTVAEPLRDAYMGRVWDAAKEVVLEAQRATRYDWDGCSYEIDEKAFRSLCNALDLETDEPSDPPLTQSW